MQSAKITTVQRLTDSPSDGGGRVWCNPPYGREIAKWVRKGFESVQAGTASVCVMLLPARTDTKWFHNYVYNKAEIRFVKGRLKFGNSKNSAPFPSMVVVFKQNKEERGEKI